MSVLGLPFRAAGEYLATTRDVLLRTEKLVAEHIAGNKGELKRAALYAGAGILASTALTGLIATAYGYRFDPLFSQVALIVIITAGALAATMLNHIVISVGTFKMQNWGRTAVMATYVQGTAFALIMLGSVLGALQLAPLWSRIRAAGDLRACSAVQIAIDPMCKEPDKQLGPFVVKALAEPELAYMQWLGLGALGIYGLLYLAILILTARAMFVFNYHAFGARWWRWFLGWGILVLVPAAIFLGGAAVLRFAA